MKQFIFLKAVNVGGSSKVPMKELVAEIKKSGIEDVSYYLNSGNLIVTSDLSSEKIMFHVNHSIETFKAGGVTLFHKNGDQLKDILQTIHFDNWESMDKSKLLIYFLSKPVTDFSPIGSNPKVTERFVGKEDILYVYYHEGIGRSALTTNYIDRVLNLESTGRNLNTIETVLGK